MNSFLPTQIHMTVPIVIHIPFKLDGSCEFVDPQGENSWFKFTIDNLIKFLKKIYIHVATIMKQDIVNYIPHKNNFFFEKTNEKIQCLLKDNLKGNIICQENAFYTTNKTFENASNIVSFAKKEKIENPEQIYSLLKYKHKLFVPKADIDMKLFGVSVIKNARELLFAYGLRNETIFEETVKILADIGKDLKYNELIEKICPITLSKSQLSVIGVNKFLSDAFNEYIHKCIRNNKSPQIYFSSEIQTINDTFSNEIEELIASTDLNDDFISYMHRIKFNFYTLEIFNHEFAIAGNKGIVLAKGFEMGSFSYLATKYDPKRVFVSSLQIR